MTRIVLFIMNLSVFFAYGQNPGYQDDLKALKEAVQKTPSFKTQIKGEKQKAYANLYLRLLSDAPADMNRIDYFHHLSQLIFPVTDNHLGFYETPDYSHFKNKETIAAYVESDDFKSYPSLTLNTDSLKTVLAAMPADSVEGIYYQDTYFSIGLFRSGVHEFTGVVVDSKINLWTKGQIACKLYETKPGIFKAIYAHPITKGLMLYTIEKYKDGKLLNSVFYQSFSSKPYSKKFQEVDYVNLPDGSPYFDWKNTQPDMDYILIRTFQNASTKKQRSDSFNQVLKVGLSAPNIVLDLRNNEGGAESEMKKYLKLFKQYTQQGGHLYVMVNNGTLSQAELFMLELRQLKNVVTCGQTTRGMLTYGNNTGKTVNLPSKKFDFYPTDMNENPQVLPYEDYGINPELILNNESEWITQVAGIIKRK